MFRTRSHQAAHAALPAGQGPLTPPLSRPGSARPRPTVLLLLAAACGSVAAQTQIDLPTQTKRVDFSGATYTRPLKSGASLPPTCGVGDMFFNTAASPGLNIYACTAINTWSVESSAGGGGGGSLTIESNGTAVGARPIADIITGTGLATLITDTGSQINVQLNMDTALVQTQFGEQTGTALLCASVSGSSSAYSCLMSPTAPAYSRGMLLHWIPDVNGAGGATTLNIDTLGPQAITLDDGASNPAASSISAGKMYLLWYDGSVFRLLPTGGSGGSVSGVADPGANGIPFRTGPGSASLATAANLSSPFACQDSGSANAYACALSPAIGSYSVGTVYWFKAANANTDASTVNLNSLGPVAIKKSASQSLAANDIRAGQWVMVLYDGSNMQMISQTAATSSLSTLRSKELSIGGYNNTGSGWSPASVAIGTVGGWSAGAFGLTLFNHTSAANAWEFRWDANWDNTQPISVMLTLADPGGNGGNYKIDFAAACVAPNSNMYTAPTFGATLSSGVITLSGTNTKEVTLSGLDISTPSCAPNLLTVIKASRDNSISGNSLDDLGLLSATLIYSVK